MQFFALLTCIKLGPKSYQKNFDSLFKTFKIIAQFRPYGIA